MRAAVSLRPCAAGWRFLLALALAAASLPTAAQSMACGTYKDTSGNTTLTLESEGHGSLSGPYQATEDLRIVRQDDVLGTGNLSTGRLENWYFSNGDRTISTPYREFTRESAAACTAMPEPIEGGCVMNTSECLESLPEAAPLQLHAWCAEGVGAACMQLLETYQQQAKDAAPTTAEPPMPEICKEASPSFDAEGCMAAAEKVASEMMGKTLLGLQHSVDAPLPPAQLDELSDLCRVQQGETFCADAAETLWSNGRLQQAREALQRSCAQRADAPACAPAKDLAVLATASASASALTPVPASTLPCGSFEAERSVLSQLRFLDDGVVESGDREQPLRASVRDGRILIHRELGSDFVLQLLQNGNLVGIDGGNRFAYYERRPGAGDRCTR